MSNILSGLKVKIDSTFCKEEVGALLDGIDENLYNDWEYDFIMDIAEKDFISDKEKEKITELYIKYIDN